MRRFLETGVIEIAPLAFMRGRTLSNAFVILDEAQNTTRASDEDVPDATGPQLARGHHR
jgi:phosphate starvation-inducible protein PhoH